MEAAGGRQPRGSAAGSPFAPAQQQRAAQEQRSPQAAHQPDCARPNPFAQARTPDGRTLPGSAAGSVCVSRRHTTGSKGMPIQQTVAMVPQSVPLPPVSDPVHSTLTKQQQQHGGATLVAAAPAEAPPAAMHADPASSGTTAHMETGSETPVNLFLSVAASEGRVARHNSSPAGWFSSNAANHSVSSGNASRPTANSSSANGASIPPNSPLSYLNPFACRSEDASSHYTLPGSWGGNSSVANMEQNAATPVADAYGGLANSLFSSLEPSAGLRAPPAAPAARHADDAEQADSPQPKHSGQHEAACIAAWVQAGEWPEAWPTLEYMAVRWGKPRVAWKCGRMQFAADTAAVGAFTLRLFICLLFPSSYPFLSIPPDLCCASAAASSAHGVPHLGCPYVRNLTGCSIGIGKL